MIHTTLPFNQTRRLSFYLAMEEYVARHLNHDDDCFFMWQVNPSVIFGRNQLIEKEVNIDYCKKHHIEMYRRKSGGGCVYADMSNVMFSYITRDENVNFTFNRYINLLVLVLFKMGIDAKANGRNDILIDGKKVSGNAFYHILLVSQASSENSTSIGVRDEDKDEAIRVLNDEFSKEIETGAMFPMMAESGLATIAIVGENMKHTPGIAGKLFGTLGRSGISVIACAQGASETNISFVVDGKFLRKSLNVLHDSFFLSEYKVLNLFICGVGTVGSKLLEQIRSQYEELKQHSRLKLNVVLFRKIKYDKFKRKNRLCSW